MGNSKWFCICDCGNERYVDGYCLRNGTSESCGCYHYENFRKSKTIHGACPRGKGKQLSEFNIWTAMKSRCYNPNNKSYPNYGGRGISVCPQWKNSFIIFLKDMGKRPSRKHSLDRYPNMDGNYEPNNCRWATMLQQCRNKRNNVWVEYNGEIKILQDWVKKFNCGKNIYRFFKKHTFEEAYNYYMNKNKNAGRKS